MIRRIKSVAMVTAIALSLYGVITVIGSDNDVTAEAVTETVVDNYVEISVEEVEEETEYVNTTPYYTVNGAFLGYELSDYLYEQLKAHDMEWFYGVALCQLYQESRFDANAVGYDGLDQGIAQLRATYFDYFMEKAGLEEADPFNPYDSICIYVCLMESHLASVEWNVPSALSKYNVGNTRWFNAEYVDAVTQWYATLELI